LKTNIKSTYFNDEYLISIAIRLLNEAKETGEGEQFKKIIPAMAFSCFALESKLNSCGNSVFSGQELKKFSNSQLIGKTDWLLTRIGAETDHEVIKGMRESIVEMISFRNAVAHSKPISFEEERELIGREKIDSRFILPSRSPDDFMCNYSIEKAEEFYNTRSQFTLVWLHYSKLYFKKIGKSPDYHIPKARIVEK